LLVEFLNQCDLAKFAGMSLSQQDMESLHRSARTFVLETAKPEASSVAGDPPQLIGGQEAHDSLPSA
jgi:hypothetical protein